MILRSAESCSLLWSYVSLLPLSSCSSLSLFITLSIVIFCVQVFNHFLFPTTSDVLQTSPPPFFFLLFYYLPIFLLPVSFSFLIGLCIPSIYWLHFSSNFSSLFVCLFLLFFLFFPVQLSTT